MAAPNGVIPSSFSLLGSTTKGAMTSTILACPRRAALKIGVNPSVVEGYESLRLSPRGAKTLRT